MEHTHDRITVTRNGRPAAVIISPDDRAALEDTLGLLSDPEAMEQLRESRAAYAAGDFLDGDQLRAKYLPGRTRPRRPRMIDRPLGYPFYEETHLRRRRTVQRPVVLVSIGDPDLTFDALVDGADRQAGALPIGQLPDVE